MVFTAGDRIHEKEISLILLGLLLAAPFISAARGGTAEFEAEATEMKGGESAHKKIN